MPNLLLVDLDMLHSITLSGSDPSVTLPIRLFTHEPDYIQVNNHRKVKR